MSGDQPFPGGLTAQLAARIALVKSTGHGGADLGGRAQVTGFYKFDVADFRQIFNGAD